MNTETPTEFTNQPVNYGQYGPMTAEPPRSQLVPTRYVVIGITVALLLMAVFIAFVIWAARYHAATIEALRDIFIIALALESCIFGIALMILLVMVIRLVNMLEFEIKPILERTNETIGMVRGTTVFMSENVVKPMTTASSYAAGVRRGIRTLFGDPRKNLK
ncbi:MAG: hypothetical protein H6659_08725 [Ardenticatenaceae bacterium]|nr:hypothetical protein [Ardenticatenaceae bacterium]MCB8988534.1 hypothetical protein [Ardenticatenaceae bacterium]